MWMGSFLFIAALSVVPWMVGFAGWYDNHPYRDILFYTPFVHSLWYGPLLYFYIKSITNFNYKISRKEVWHLAPGIVYLFYNIVIIVVDVVILDRYFLMDENADPDFDYWYQLLSMLSLIYYLVISFNYLKNYKSYTYNELSFAEIASMRWLRNFSVAFAVITFLPIINDALSNLSAFKKLRYVGPWYYFFSFGLVVYYIAINAYNSVVIPLRKLNYHPELLQSKNQAPTIDLEVAVDIQEKNHLIDSKLEPFIQELELQMAEKKYFTNQELTLNELAKILNTNSVYLSKAINQGKGQNFNDFINQYRVKAVLSMMKDPAFKHFSLLGMAYEAGFNSKSTFNRAFKKVTGSVPKDFNGFS